VLNNTSTNDGSGGILNMGRMEIQQSLIKRNSANTGGIWNEGTLLVSNSAVIGNDGSQAGGILNEKQLTVVNSTISENSAITGGGIINNGIASLNNVSIVGNSAIDRGGGIFVVDLEDVSVSIQNSILAKNQTSDGKDGPDCMGNLESSGYNLIEDSGDCIIHSGPGDITQTDPLLGPLEGSPGYHPLLPGSPAIDAGNPQGCTDQEGNLTASDQRGRARFGRCDIGAYELQPLGFSSKAVNASPVYPHEPVTYTITLTNGGETDILDATVTDALPADLTYIAGSLTASSGEFGYDNGTISWVGSVLAGSEETITFGATPAFTEQPVINSAVIAGDGDVFIRSASLQVTPRKALIPCLLRTYCTPAYFDDFSDPNSGWPILDNELVQFAYVSGEYKILVKDTYSTAGARSGFQASDFIAGVDVRNPNSYMGSFGLIFGLSDDWKEFYTFEIRWPGWYSIWKYEAKSGWDLLAEGASSDINLFDATNHLELKRNGALIEAYVNTHPLVSVRDDDFLGMRHVGLIVRTVGTWYLDIRFDNFGVWPVSCGRVPGFQPPSILSGGIEATQKDFSQYMLGPNDQK
jgi:uncharacterized repeat protein (TIGR01451 family)